MGQLKTTVRRVLRGRIPEQESEDLAEIHTPGRWTHNYPSSFGGARQLGVPLSTDRIAEA